MFAPLHPGPLAGCRHIALLTKRKGGQDAWIFAIFFFYVFRKEVQVNQKTKKGQRVYGNILPYILTEQA